MDIAPVALFAFNRPDHLERTLDALRHNDLADTTSLVVFADGARSGRDESAVAAVRRLLRSVMGFKDVTVVAREKNYGLAASIIEGVTSLVTRHGRVIVLEDDLVTSPYFLKYMNDGLNLYADTPQVACISGYIYPVDNRLPESFFLRGADCWGWATWARSWNLFNPNGHELMAEIEKRKLGYAFDLSGGGPYTAMLKGQVRGLNDSWAVRWYASAFLAGGLTLYPGQSLVRNIGNDGSGRHCPESVRYDVETADHPIHLAPLSLEENARARTEVARFFWRQRRFGSLVARLRWSWRLLWSLERIVRGKERSVKTVPARIE